MSDQMPLGDGMQARLRDDDHPAPYVPAVVPPDPARDRRVAARRAEESRRASRALDRLLEAAEELRGAAFSAGYSEGYYASEEHHKRHYARPGGGDDVDLAEDPVDYCETCRGYRAWPHRCDRPVEP